DGIEDVGDVPRRLVARMIAGVRWKRIAERLEYVENERCRGNIHARRVEQLFDRERHDLFDRRQVLVHLLLALAAEDVEDRELPGHREPEMRLLSSVPSREALAVALEPTENAIDEIPAEKDPQRHVIQERLARLVLRASDLPERPNHLVVQHCLSPSGRHALQEEACRRTATKSNEKAAHGRPFLDCSLIYSREAAIRCDEGSFRPLSC